jgi:hypothetical protein
MASDTINLIRQLGGELITYTPFGGAAKSLWAIVERDRTAIESQLVNGAMYAVSMRHILVANDPNDGITSVIEHKDRVSFKKNLSDAAETVMTVQTILKQDAGLAGDTGGFLLMVQA